ncbi:hypothetical protein [Hymenobacter terrenus]|uniref:hypothetical protein n=1 Tax=Hymenobacter terrenus TaxID=1629124 RepID=UPI00061A0740|nr:hypothetical protein [Hymenobacter terrenus]
MPDSTPDFYYQKTDAELLFFVEHPAHYAPGMVEAAQRELRRRGVAPSAPVAPPPPSTEYPPANEDAAPKTGLYILGLTVLLVISLAVFYLIKQKNSPSSVVAAAPAKVRKAPPRLIEVATSAIPNYDGVVAAAVARQLRDVPAAEKADAQHLRQFRELSKRFWAAETQSEYLINQAYDGKAGPMFADQALVARGTWQIWNDANVYSYKFGPVMREKLSRMSQAASGQQHILDQLPGLLPGRKFLTDMEIKSRITEVQDLVGGLLPVSPVSGQPYKRILLKAKSPAN